MPERPEVGEGRGKKAYQKPAIARVDLVEDEVALASCKRSTSGNVMSSGVSSTMSTCRSSCSGISST